jgi:putative addiction module component (TIGR02574 family)
MFGAARGRGASLRIRARTGLPFYTMQWSTGRSPALRERYTRHMAQPPIPPAGFDELSADEKLAYIQALWDHFSGHAEEVPVPEWHRDVLAERLAAHRRGESNARPWPEVREELLARLRNTG